MSKTILQLLHSLAVALATAALAFLQGVDVGGIGTGVTAILAAAVVGLLVRGAGWVVGKLGPAAPAE